MRRTILLVTVALVMATIIALSAGAALAAEVPVESARGICEAKSHAPEDAAAHIPEFEQPSPGECAAPPG